MLIFVTCSRSTPVATGSLPVTTADNGLLTC